MIQVDYFGVFTDEAVENLVGRVVEEGARGRVIVIRMDRAIMAFRTFSAKARARFANCRVPGVVVCRPDQRGAIEAICGELSASGVLRVVFLDHSAALQWADRLAVGIQAEEAARMPNGKPLHEQDRYLVGCQTAPPANERKLKTAVGR